VACKRLASSVESVFLIVRAAGPKTAINPVIITTKIPSAMTTSTSVKPGLAALKFVDVFVVILIL
jgi:hypothetical protein